eukprot:m.162483 g.162483  ORF g.162483 m.162483 type:complete len:370 (+) comp15205_c0_seq2:273-1382(+)
MEEDLSASKQPCAQPKVPQCAGLGCDKPAKLRCPTCSKGGITDGSYFCSQDCFKKNWTTHKKLCKRETGSEKKTEAYNTDGDGLIIQAQTSAWLKHGLSGLHRTLEAQLSYFRRRPYLENIPDMEKKIEQGLERKLRGDFCWSLTFTPAFFDRLLFEGFLPICTDVSDQGEVHVLLPKWHVERCVLNQMSDLHYSKKVRRRAGRYTLTVNTDINQVLRGVIGQHGENWFYKPIRQILRALHQKSSKHHCRTFTFECWNEDNKLVAGDVGIVCGGIYTSLSGFYTEDGSGTIQICAMVKLLARWGFSFVDLGQHLDYKIKLGATMLPRSQFLQKFRSARQSALNPMTENQRWNCKELLSSSTEDSNAETQ